MNDLAINSIQTKRLDQPWLKSAQFDVLLIIAPAFIASLVVILFKEQFDNYDHIPVWAWVSFVLLVDVAHVYSSLFRTYLEPSAFSKNKSLLLTIPVLCWAAGSLLYSFGALVFWKALAYLAVFHFIRQQFGFMALYSRKETESVKRFRWIDGAVIYLSTLYPLLYWHTNLPRNFNWFIEGDFFTTIPNIVTEIALVLYVIFGLAYTVKEIIVLKTTGFINIPKNLIVIGTGLSWWIGIIALNSDLAFTMTNVLAHGIPYMALIWLYHHKPLPETSGTGLIKSFVKTRNFVVSHIPLFLGFLFLLAYLEEGLWDGFIWREHQSVFAFFRALPELTNPGILCILIPFLALPQSTHYVLDGFIWRIKDKNSIWTA